jgi:hypothetical protein
MLVTQTVTQTVKRTVKVLRSRIERPFGLHGGLRVNNGGDIDIVPARCRAQVVESGRGRCTKVPGRGTNQERLPPVVAA